MQFLLRIIIGLLLSLAAGSFIKTLGGSDFLVGWYACAGMTAVLFFPDDLPRP